MNLLETRKLLVNLSGRFDLVKDTTDYEDNGADFFLNAGHRMLDRLVTHSKSEGYSDVYLIEGIQEYALTDFLSVRQVQVTTDSGAVTLKKISESEINEGLAEGASIPRFYSLYTDIRSPLDRTRERRYQRLSIKIWPSPQEGLILKVFGRISKTLEEDEDFSFWTLQAPETLVRAALYQIESFHRNSQGMNDFMNALMQDVRNLDYDIIESEVGELNQMNDSFYFRGKGNVR